MPHGGTKKQKKRNADKGSHGFTPESLESVSPLSSGLYAISACECLRISLFPRLFFSARSSFILFLQQRFTPAIILLMIVVLYHTMASLRH